MLADIFKLFEEANEVVKIENLIVGLATKIPIDNNNLDKGIEQMQENFPELSNYDFDEKKDIISLQNEYEDEADKKTFAILNNKTTFRLSWAQKHQSNSDFESKTFYDILQDSFGINLFKIDYIDVALRAHIEFDGDHNNLIKSVFYNEESSANVFSENHFLRAEHNILGLIDKENDRRVFIEVETDQTAKEILSGNFNNKEIKLGTFIGQRKQISKHERIYDCFLNHRKCVYEFVKDSYFPHIIDPIEKYIN